MDRIRRIYNYIINLNLFEKDQAEEHVRREQIISTRVYIILLTIILSIFTLYLSLLYQTTVIIIPTPSQLQYEQLEVQLLDTLQCPCTHISIPYEVFITINPSYHEICSSDFISQQWIDYLFYENTSYYFQLDYRRSASSYFQLLRTLCQQVQRRVNDSLTEFYLKQFIGVDVISHKTFDIQVNSFIKLFQVTTSSLFQHQLKLIREIFNTNQLFSAIDVLYNIQYARLSIPYVLFNDIFYYETQSQGKNFGCFCGNQFECKLPIGIYANLNQYVYAGSNWMGKVNATTNMINATFLVPGMYAGCSSFESLMKSTTECLSNDSCLNRIFPYFHNALISIGLLNKLNISRFDPQTTFEMLVNELFIEYLNDNKSYEKYFTQCQPLYCQYTKEQKSNFIQILASIISLYGGLRLVLTIVIPFSVKFILKKKRIKNITIDVSHSSISISNRLRSLFRFMINLILKMNIYNRHAEDEHIQRMEIISTRIYFIVMIITLAILTLYTSLKTQSKVITINYPTEAQFEQLEKHFANNLHCPCDEASIKYGNLITFQPIYHQICSSGFVSDLWSQADFWIPFSMVTTADFRYRSPFTFSLLSTLCQSTKQVVIDSLSMFYSKEYITSEVASPNLFKNEIISFIELFEITTQRSFMVTLNLVRRIIFGNQLGSGMALNIGAKIYNVTDYMEVHTPIWSLHNCSCSNDAECKEQLSFGNLESRDDVVGMYYACFFLDSILLSSTECFYKETCVNQIKSYMYSNHTLYDRLQVLNTSQITHYKYDDLFETLVNNLFIEDWNASYFYDIYYNICKPTYCSYIIKEKPNFLYTLARIIGVFGGLSAVIIFLAPYIASLIRRNNRTASDTHPSIIIRIRKIIRGLLPLIKEKIINLNLFDRGSTNLYILRRQRITTRLYLIILIIILIILLFYTSLNKQSKSTTIKSPTLIQYERLQIQYPNTLNCPCDHISIEYQSFLQMTPFYHDICSSDFVGKEWIEYLHDIIPLEEPNYRKIASIQFHFLSLLCQLAKDTISNGLTQFHGTKFINNRLIPRILFETQIQSIIDIFKASVPQSFKRTSDLIRGLIQGNAIISAYETNWKYTFLNKKRYASVYTNPRSYNNNLCNCGTTQFCKQSATISNDLNSTLPGLFIGCYPVESLLQSTLECLYDQTCINLILSLIEDQSLNVTFKALNPFISSNSLYSINETVQHMVDRLFVDNWYVNQSYEDYFTQCYPSKCIYSYIENFDIVYIVTTILGLFSGLSISLKIVSQIIVRVIFYVLRRKQRSVTPSLELLERTKSTSETDII